MSNTATTVRGASWAVIARLGSQGVQFGLGLVLARVLMPSDFGLAASVYAVTGLALVFLDLGLGSAVVRWVHPSQRDLSTVFWLNVANGLLFETIVLLCSPLLADFYGQPSIRLLGPLAGLAFVVTVGAVHQALLSREMHFRSVAAINAIGGIAGSISTLLMALAGLGAVSLVLGPVVACAVSSAGLLYRCRWRPSLVFDLRAVRQVWSYSSGLLGAQSVEYLAQNVDNVLLARVWGPGVLGYYSRAFNLMLLPVNQITGALGSVIFPMLVRANATSSRLASAYVRCAVAIFALVSPVLVIMLVLAQLLVPVLWGARWEATAVPLQALCVAGLARVTTLSTGWVLQVVGKTRLMFKLAILEVALTVMGIVGGLSWGGVGVAIGVAAASVLYLPANVVVTFRELGVSPAALTRRLLRVTICLLAAAATMIVIAAITIGTGTGGRLVLASVGGLLVYLATLIVLDRELVGEWRVVRGSARKVSKN